MRLMLQDFWQFLRVELAPQEGRWAMAWRTAALCALVAMVFMTYGIPLAPIACYLVLFVIKPNTAESLLMSLGVMVLVAIVIPLLVGLAVISVDNVLARMLVLCLGSFVFMYLSVASKVGEIGSILALMVGFVMTLVGMAPFGEVLTRGILYAGLMAIAPMAMLLIFLALLGPSPAKLAQRHLLRRCQALAAVVRGEQDPSHLLAFLRQGHQALEKMLLFTTLFSLLPRAHIEQLKQLTHSSYQAMAAWVALPEHIDISTAMRERWNMRLNGIAEALEQHSPIPSAIAAPLSQALPARLQEIDHRMQALPALPALSAMAQGTAHGVSAKKSGFFHDDVASNRSYAQFGVKVTFCALICYLTYTALQWQDIHTAMITCYVAALGTVGETVHKLVLRIAGCLVGAALGCASIFFLMPHMSNIGQLMALVFAGCTLAAWVAQGSQRIAYAGVQIGLAFLLTVLQGFGPDGQISVALDRVYGILLGNVVVFLVFTQVWPVNIASQMDEILKQHLSELKKFIFQPPAEIQPKIQAALPELLPQLESLREQSAMLYFEVPFTAPSAQAQEPITSRINALENIYLQTAFENSFLQTPQAQNKLQALHHSLKSGEGASCT